MRRVEPARAPATRLNPSRFAIPENGVARRAAPNPGGELLGNRTIVRALADVTEIPGDCLPLRAVPNLRPGNRVRDLVQEHLMNFVIVETACQVAGHRNPVRTEIAQPGAGLRVVEAE